MDTKQKIEMQLGILMKTHWILRQRMIRLSGKADIEGFVKCTQQILRVSNAIEQLKVRKFKLLNQKENVMKKISSIVAASMIVIGCGSNGGSSVPSLPIDVMVQSTPAPAASTAPEAAAPAATTEAATPAPASTQNEAPVLASALKLAMSDCVDPDMSKVASGVKVTLCNGTLATGTMSVPTACTFNGETSCIANGLYMAANLNNLSPSNIKSGVSVAGVSGTYAPADAHVDCSSNGQIGCVSTSSFKAADISSLTANNLRSGVVVAGITGTLVPEAHATSGEIIAESHTDCSANGQVGCVTTATYKSANLSNLVAANIKTGVNVAGVTGGYPSSSFPLASSDTAVEDLDAATFPIKIKASSAFEWFDSNGNRYSRSGDTALADNTLIKKDASIFGTTGTYSAASQIAREDYRYGVSIDGVGGKLLPSCHDTDEVTVLGGVVPCWSAKTLNVIDLTPGMCGPSTTTNCMYKDAVTNLIWARNSETLPGKTWSYENARLYCQNLTLNGQQGFRIPSKAEVFRAHSTFFPFVSPYFKRGGTTWTTYNTSNVVDANNNILAKKYLGMGVSGVIDITAEYEDGTRGPLPSPGVYCVK